MKRLAERKKRNALKKSGLLGYSPEEQKLSDLSPKKRAERPQTTKAGGKNKMDFTPMFKAEELEETNLDEVEVAIGQEPHEAGKSKSGSFINKESNNLNEISKIDNTTAGDTSLNLTGAELVNKLQAPSKQKKGFKYPAEGKIERSPSSDEQSSA